jgi:RimJ/RimL family protein N-acetyltransferase
VGRGFDSHGAYKKSLTEYNSDMSYPLLTDRLSIQPLTLADIETFVAYRQDPEIARYQSWDPRYSKAQAVELIESQAGVLLPGQDQWLQLAIHNRISGELVGDLAIHSIEDNHSIFEIGFTIARKQQGQGFAKEAAQKLLAHLELQGATKFFASTDSRNTPSKKLLTELGFELQPSKGWTEQFKGELVTVEYFETN